MAHPVEEHRREGQRREHGDEWDQHAADPDRADERQRQQHHAEQADRHGRAGDDHRSAGMRHRLDQRRLDVSPVVELLAEPEDHQQRVVDRDSEPDERDEELDDDRDVRDVGERPDRAEGRDDRDRGRDQRHADRGERSEDEQQHEQRADASDQDFDRGCSARRCRRCPPAGDRGR